MVIQYLSASHKDFPTQLSHIDPKVTGLYLLGELPTTPMVTIVGSRKPSQYGREVTYKLAYDCAQAGLAIVSGLALGLDAVAHQAALDAGGATVAVLPCGLDEIYPKSHRRLAIDILKSGGALVSEYSAGTPALKHQFVARNRIEAGLSEGVVVTEAMASSGTLITANYGLQFNKAVMAVPGSITSVLSAGPNNLLRSGAIPVVSSADIIEAIGLDAAPVTKPEAVSEIEQLIFDLMDRGIVDNDKLIAGSGLTAAELATTLSLMEITGKIKNHGAGIWSLR